MISPQSWATTMRGTRTGPAAQLHLHEAMQATMAWSFS